MTFEDESEEDIGVYERPGGDVLIRLGKYQPFEIPFDAAIRLAALLCKKAGCDVMFREGSMKIKFPGGFRFMDEAMTDSVGSKVN